jgi:hypothetical protein
MSDILSEEPLSESPKKVKSPRKAKPRRKPIASIISRFGDLPRDMIIEILGYDERFYLSKDGAIISRFIRKDPRYIILARIPKINYIWSYYYVHGNIVSQMISMVFLSKNKKHRYSLTYSVAETAIGISEGTFGVAENKTENIFHARKVIFSNKLAVYSYEASSIYEHICYI